MYPASKIALRRSDFSSILLALLTLFLVTACERVDMDAAENSKELQDKETVVVLRTNRGDITVRFFPETSPEHVKNFIAHSESGFYVNTLFHRVIPGFMIQGGDPNTKDDDPGNDGKGGYSYKGEGTSLQAEFNEIPHTRGILSMARNQNINSAGSQFFIMHQDFPQLNGQYTVFGEVIDGIDVVDHIVNTPRNHRDRPMQDQRIEQTIVEEWPSVDVEKTKSAMWKEHPIAQAQSDKSED
ncbi:MAG: peptidylprolyl isomerase [Aestuariibacter sp.]